MMHKKSYHSILLLLFSTLLYWPMALHAQQQRKGGNKPARFYSDTPARPFDIIVSRTTDESTTLSVITYDSCKAFIRYGESPTKPDHQTGPRNCSPGSQELFVLSGLAPDQEYYYRLCSIYPGETKENTSPLYHFKTKAAASHSFVFNMLADSHLDENCDTAMYRQTLLNMESDSADFLVDLGDTYMTDKFKPDYKVSLKQYQAQRYYFGLAAHSSTLYFTPGNHDGETGQSLKGRNADGMMSWAESTRLKYYSNPLPDKYYSGNVQPSATGNLPQDYYAWEWGNALCVVLDPFRYTTGGDPWQRTLGKAQYDWLETTLRNSRQAFKFIFIHNLVGGMDLDGKARGGAEAASFYEWGGSNADSTSGFAANRPGWNMPIHELLRKYHVTAVFHGHDHFFAKQEKDGIIYQLVPQPGSERYEKPRTADEYGYKQGMIMQAPGYLRVRMNKDVAHVEYVQTAVSKNRKNGDVIFSYDLKSLQ